MKHLVLLGAGAAHLRLLRALAAQPMTGARITWLVPGERVFHAPMLADWLVSAGAAEAPTIALPPLAAAARVDGVEADVEALDAAARELRLADGTVLRWDVLSVDAEPALDRDAIAGAREHALFVHPLVVFARLWDAVLALAAERSLCIVVVGGDAPAVELAAALQALLAERARVSLVTGGGPPAGERPPAQQQHLQRALRRFNVTVLAEPAVAITATQVVLASGVRLACDAPFIAGPAAPPRWLAASGLALDEEGRIALDAALHSTSHPVVFGVGGAVGGVDARAAAGALALNLRRRVAGGTLLPYRAPARRIEWLVSGERRAIAAWATWAVEGRWVWHLKQRGDRRVRLLEGGDAAASAVARPERDHEG